MPAYPSHRLLAGSFTLALLGLILKTNWIAHVSPQLHWVRSLWIVCAIGAVAVGILPLVLFLYDRRRGYRDELTEPTHGLP
jgi:hypothetical protein